MFKYIKALIKGQTKEEVYDSLKEVLISPYRFKEFYSNNITLGLHHFYKGNFNDAKFRFKMLCSVYKKKILPRYYLARCLLFLDRKEEARKIFEDFIKDPAKEYDEVKFYLSVIEGLHLSKIPTYVSKEKFDNIAEDYVEKFIIGKQYIGHKLIFEGLSRVMEGSLNDISVLELGCGTGVCTHFIKLNGIRFSKAHGVDISSNMLEIAKRCIVDGNPVFDSVINRDIASYLFSTEDKYNLIIAADSLNYLGDLSDVIPSCLNRLEEGGVLAILVPHSVSTEQDYILNPDYCSFSYSLDYIQRLSDNIPSTKVLIRKCKINNTTPGIMVFYSKV